jgi:hypothetical protein
MKKIHEIKLGDLIFTTTTLEDFVTFVTVCLKNGYTVTVKEVKEEK